MPLSPEALAAKTAATDKEKEKAAAEKEKAEPTLDFKEPPPKMIGQGFEKRPLRKLSPEEKVKLRLKVNIAMGIMGGLILALFTFILTHL